MREMIVRGMHIDDTFAEAFNMRATGVVITADSARWARQAAVTMIGFATSVIGCGCEAGIDSELSPRETPDRRPGIRGWAFRCQACRWPPRHGPRLCRLGDVARLLSR